MDADAEIGALRADLIERFADDVAHEIRNPLNALVINIEVLRRRVANGDADAAMGRLDVLEQEVGRVHTIVERFIALLRPARAAEPTSDLAEALDDVLPLLALRAAALRSAFEGPGPIDLDVRLPRERLRFVLLDAGMAALDRAGRDGHLSCVAGTVDGFCSITLRGRPTTGPDSRDPEEGSLRLARAILREVGGTVDVDPADDGGFEIRISMPAVA